MNFFMNMNYKEKMSYQGVQVETEQLPNENHFLGERVLLCSSPNNNNRIVHNNPRKLYVRVWLWHGSQFLPFELVIKHEDVAMHNLEQLIGSEDCERKAHNSRVFHLVVCQYAEKRSKFRSDIL